MWSIFARRVEPGFEPGSCSEQRKRELALDPLRANIGSGATAILPDYTANGRASFSERYPADYTVRGRAISATDILPATF